MSRREIHLTLESRLENVALAGRALHGIGVEAGLAPEACAELELCVVEAVTNCIQHAYGGQPGHEVRIDVTQLGDGVEVRVVDQGTPIPPGVLEAPEPEVTDDPLALAEGGRGLFILRQLTDSLDYVSDARGNVLTLVKRASPALTAPN